jgi:hypothetical protein
MIMGAEDNSNGGRIARLELAVGKLSEEVHTMALKVATIATQTSNLVKRFDDMGKPGDARECKRHEERLYMAEQCIHNLKLSWRYLAGACAAALVLVPIIMTLLK